MKIKKTIENIRKKRLVIVGILFLIIGISLIFSAVYMKYKGQYKQKDMINKFEKKLKDNKTINKKKEPISIIKDGKTIGIMTIPKIGLKVTIGQGTDMKTLKYALGHFSNTPMPGEKGNFCVAGHRSYTYNKYFNRLNEIKNGDEIIVTTLKGKFKYIVNKIVTVEPKDTYVLDSTKDATITLVTCTPIRIATHRLIIKGVLKK